MFIRAYLRASTDEQDAERAKQELQIFAQSKDVKIACYYVENVSGTALETRHGLNQLIDEAHGGDVILIEKLDRLTRLPYERWVSLKERINRAGLQIVVVDQPMTHAALTESANESMITKVLTDFMIDLAAAMARDDYETRRKRQAQGIAQAKKNGVYKGRQKNERLRLTIRCMLKEKVTWSQIQAATGCSRSTIAKVAKEGQKSEIAQA